MSATLISHAAQIKAAIAPATSKALTKCGMIAQGYAQQYVPSPASKSTGFLRQSIAFRSTEKQMEIYSSAPYAGYVEFGTGHFSTYEGGAGASNKASWVYPAGLGANGEMTFRRAYPMQARPFIKPALADHISTYEWIIHYTLKGG